MHWQIRTFLQNPIYPRKFTKLTDFTDFTDLQTTDGCGKSWASRAPACEQFGMPNILGWA